VYDEREGSGWKQLSVILPSITTFAVGIAAKQDRPVSETRTLNPQQEARGMAIDYVASEGRKERKKEKRKSTECATLVSHNGAAEHSSSVARCFVFERPGVQFGPEDQLSCVTFLVGYQHLPAKAGSEYQCTSNHHPKHPVNPIDSFAAKR
jgi:hypothetical protein